MTDQPKQSISKKISERFGRAIDGREPEQSWVEFDKKFPCIQNNCDGTGSIPVQVSEHEVEAEQCQFHAEYLIPIKKYITPLLEAEHKKGYEEGLQLRRAYNDPKLLAAERASVLEEVKGKIEEEGCMIYTCGVHYFKKETVLQIIKDLSKEKK